MTLKAICLPIVLPDSVNRDTLQMFIDARCEDIKKPMTERALKMLLNKIARLEAQGHCPNLLLERSIIAGWQDVYPDTTTLKISQSFIATHTDRAWRESFIEKHSDTSWADDLPMH